MLDIKYIRENLEVVQKNSKLRGSKVDPAEVVALDDERLGLLKQVEELRGQKNEINNEVKKSGRPSEEQVTKGKEIKERLTVLETKLADTERLVFEKASWLPNMLSDDTPLGEGEADNVEVKAWSPERGYFPKEELGKANFSGQYQKKLDFTPKTHNELGLRLGIIDTEQSAKVSGSRFYYLKGAGVLLQQELFYLLQLRLIKEGFTPLVVPLLVKDKILFGTSHFPGDADQVYKIETKNVEEGQELYLVGSSEPSLFGYFMDKTLKEEELPQKVFTTSTCFRSEVGSWGKDVKGAKRVHQFDKLEMDVVTTPENSAEVHEYLLSINEWFLQNLKIPYHVILMCSGDAGYAATYKKYDVEAWMPGSNTYMELMSDTNTSDFQARRFNIRYSTTTGERHLAHTVNDTGCASPRILLALLENFQNADGSITVPEVLREYVGKEVLNLK